jgi:thioredoxin-like negative regulator of GroEL
MAMRVLRWFFTAGETYMTEPTAELLQARQILDAALADERDAFDALIDLAESAAPNEQVAAATAALDNANEAVTQIQARITLLEKAQATPK